MKQRFCEQGPQSHKYLLLYRFKQMQCGEICQFLYIRSSLVGVFLLQLVYLVISSPVDIQKKFPSSAKSFPDVQKCPATADVTVKHLTINPLSANELLFLQYWKNSIFVKKFNNIIYFFRKIFRQDNKFALNKSNKSHIVTMLFNFVRRIEDINHFLLTFINLITNVFTTINSIKYVPVWEDHTFDIFLKCRSQPESKIRYNISQNVFFDQKVM